MLFQIASLSEQRDEWKTTYENEKRDFENTRSDLESQIASSEKVRAMTVLRAATLAAVFLRPAPLTYPSPHVSLCTRNIRFWKRRCRTRASTSAASSRRAWRLPVSR